MIILSVAAMLLPAVDRDPPRAPASEKKKCRTLLQSYPVPEPGRVQKLDEMPRGGIIFAALNFDSGCQKPIMASQHRRGQR